MPTCEWRERRSEYGYFEWTLEFAFTQHAMVEEMDISGSGVSRGFERSEARSKVYYAEVNGRRLKVEGFRTSTEAMQACEDRLLMDAKAIVDFLKKKRRAR